MTPRTDACIDGFPRSGNTLAVYAFWRSNPEVRLAHHLHAAAEVERAVRRSVPTVVMIREPAASIASLILYSGMKMHPRLGIETYIAFYQHVRRLQDGFAPCTFDQLMTDPRRPITLLNERLGTDFLNLPLDEGAQAELRAAIAHTQRLRGDPSRKWSVPTAKREAVKAAVADAVRRDRRFPLADELYRAFVDLSGSPDTAGA